VARGRGSRTRRLLLAALVAAAFLLGVGPPGADARRPNIVVVQTDDQDARSMNPRVMPNLTRLFGRFGTSFTQYVVSGPLCCPSRAAMLTGQYGHNNGVMWNNTPAYAFLRQPGNTLPVWLRRAGYRTVHLGKYVHDYARAVGDPNAVPPGWSDWQTVLEPVSYYDYVLRVNGRPVRYRERDDDYLTRVLNRRAMRVIERYAPGPEPFFLALDQFAPHRSGYRDPRCGNYASPDRADGRAFLAEPLPRPPSFDEPDISDKPSFALGRPRIASAGRAQIAREYRCRLASLRAVDRGVEQIHRALARAGELSNTVFVFTSDNGWFAGEHRIPAEKIDPYEEALRVPLMVRLPPRLKTPGSPRVSGAPVANVDIAPTLLALAGARPCRAPGQCRTLDGRSLAGLLRGRGRSWPSDRAVLLELYAQRQRVAFPFTSCDYSGLRTPRRAYVEHRSATGASGDWCRAVSDRERYDLTSDPYELRNLSPPPPGPPDVEDLALAGRLARLRDCAGVAGRDPLPVSGHFCE
jgi:N-acetylglucosamine-6-sulfatase